MRNVIFDLGGVVLDWDPARILADLYPDPAVQSALQAALFQHPDWLELDRGTLLEEEALVRLQTRIDRPPEELVYLLAAVRRSLKPKAETVALLETLSARGIPLYCLSNMPVATFAYLRETYDFWPVFRGIVISGEVKMMKPEPAIFAYLLRRYGLAAPDTVFIDDHLPNVRAAAALGLRAIRFVDAGQCARELEVQLSADAFSLDQRYP